MAKGSIITKMGNSTSGTGTIIKNKEMAYIYMAVTKDMKGNLRIIWSTAMAKYTRIMAIYTKDSSFKIYSTIKEYTMIV